MLPKIASSPRTGGLAKPKEWTPRVVKPQEPAVTIRIGLEGKIWTLGQEKGFSAGPQTAIELTCAASELPQAVAWAEREVQGILSREMNQVVQNIQAAMDKAI